MANATAVYVRHRPEATPLTQTGAGVGVQCDLTQRLVEDQAGDIRELIDIAGRRGVSR